MRPASENRRYLALWFPFLPIDRMRLTRAEVQTAVQDRQPFVLIRKEKNALSIASADAAALQLGLYPGLALADARARVTELLVFEADPAADFALLTWIARWCERFTPLTAFDHPYGLILDITGCAHLFGGESKLVKSICKKVEEFGFQVRTAIAGTPDAARALCRYGQPSIVPQGGEAKAVSLLPVEVLGDAVVVHALRRAGLKTIGDLAERPSTPLAARFGEAITTQLRRLLGHEDIRITPYRPPPDCMVEQSFAEPLTQQFALEAALQKLTAKIALVLEARGEGGRRFEASFFRSDGLVRGIVVETARPTQDAVSLLQLFHERLAALADPLDPGFGFDLIRLSVNVTESFDQRQTALDGGVDGDEEFSLLADRLAARFGKDRVRKFVSVNSHIPELAERTFPAAVSVKGAAWEAPQTGEPPARPLYMFDPPQPIDTLAEVPDGPPIRFKWRRVVHDVARSEGPERISPEWWNGPDRLTRDYYRIEDVEGRRFWVYREGLYARETTTPQWFMHGLFA